MSMVIAVKDKDRVYMACDSQSSQGSYKHIMENDGSMKMFRSRELDNCVIGGVGLCNIINILRYKNIFPESICYRNELDHEFLQTEFGFRVREIIKDNELEDDGNNNSTIGSNFIIAHKNKIYHLCSDLMVKEYKDFGCSGSCKDIAFGSLETSKGEPVKTRIIKAMLASVKYDFAVDFPLVIMNTKNNKTEILTEKDCLDYLKGEENNDSKEKSNN